MRSLRPAPFVALALAAVAVAACGTANAPGWTFAPAPSVTPAASAEASTPASAVPSEPAASPSAAASAPVASGSPAASGGAGEALTVTAQGIKFVEKELTAPADTAFQIRFVNEDQVPHDVDIRDSSGATIDDNDIQATAGEIVYDVPALAAGQYTFICSIHPIPDMTGTLTVQ